MFGTDDQSFGASSRLRLQPTRLIDRDQELDRIQLLLLEGDIRLVTLTGPAGVGKTRLAVEAGLRIGDSFRDGVSFLDLSPIHDPDLVLSALAESVGLEHAQSEMLLQRHKEHLQHRNMLLILDNFDRLIPAASHLAELLASCPEIRFLVTSREPLQLLWEHVIQVQPLPVPDLDDMPSLQELRQIPSVALFLQRAQAIDSDFALTEDDARTVAELCVRLDGLPLSIELAAAWVRLLSPAMILERLEDCFSVLRWPGQDLPAHQQTMRAAMDCSYDSLDETDQQLFRHVGVFASGFNLEAVEALEAGISQGAIDSNSVLEGMSSLVNKSMVLVDREGENEVRYRLLETMRQYAEGQLAAYGEEDQTRRAHADFFLRLAELAEPQLQGPGQALWFMRLGRELENLRAAMRWLVDHGEGEQALRMATSLGYFWWTRGFLAEGQRNLKIALAQVPESVSSLRARALNALAIILLSGGQLEQSHKHLEEALALARSLDDRECIAKSLANLGLLAQRRGEWEQSTRLLGEAKTQLQAIGDVHDQIYASVHCAFTALYDGDFERAGQLLTEEQSTSRDLGDIRNTVQSSIWVAYLAAEQGDVVRASTILRSAMEWTLRLGDYRLLYHGGVLFFSSTPLVTWLAAMPGNAERLTRFFGAGEALCVGTGYVPSTWVEVRIAESIAFVKSRLTPETFAAQLHDGRSLSFKQMADLALELLESASDGASEPPPQESPQRVLSEREEAVLRLVAEGLPNKAIAQQLNISPSTVSYHLTSIFNKLGVNTRAQAVSVATQRHIL